MRKILCFFGFHKWKKEIEEANGIGMATLYCQKCGSRITLETNPAGGAKVHGIIPWILPRTEYQYRRLQRYFINILKKYKILTAPPAKDKNGCSYSLGNRRSRRETSQKYKRYTKKMNRYSKSI